MSYTECYKIAVRMHDELRLNPGETLRETWSIGRSRRLVHLTEQLGDREVELRARQADEVADVFANFRTTVGTFLGFAVAVEGMDDPRCQQIGDLHTRTMLDLRELVRGLPRLLDRVGGQSAASTMAPAHPRTVVRSALGSADHRAASLRAAATVEDTHAHYLDRTDALPPC